MKKKVIFLIILIILLGIGFWIYKHFKNNAMPVQMPNMEIPVSAMSVTLQKVNLYEKLPGRATSYEIAEVRPRITGTIIARSFEQGGYVKKGDVLYKINPDTYQASYDQAKANLTKAEASFTAIKAREGRYKTLVKQGAISKQDYDNVSSEYYSGLADIEVAKAQLQTASINLGYTNVTAPIEGIIGQTNITPGALVTANQAEVLTTITRLDPIYVDMEQPIARFFAIKSEFKNTSQQFPVTLYLDSSFEPYKEQGKIEFSNVVVNKSTGTVLLRSIFPNPNHLIYPGLFVRGNIHFDTKDYIVVPQSATFRNPQGDLQVWLITKDNKVNPTIVKPLEAQDDNWVIEHGLNPGDNIVTTGIQKLKPNVTVKPTFETKN